MTEAETKIREAFAKCANARLPDDFADRLVERIRENGNLGAGGTFGSALPRLALVAASLSFLLGFVPNVLYTSSVRPAENIVRVDSIRPAGHRHQEDGQLNALALFGFCREAVRRRVRPFWERVRRRRDDE